MAKRLDPATAAELSRLLDEMEERLSRIDRKVDLMDSELLHEYEQTKREFA